MNIKKILIIVLIGIFLICNYALAAPPPWTIFIIPSQTVPKDVVVDTILINVDITRNDTSSHNLRFDVSQTYSLRNIGNETLEINPNGGRLINFTAEKIQLKPNEKANLTFRFLTYGRPLPETGKIRVITDLDIYGIYKTDSKSTPKSLPSLSGNISIPTSIEVCLDERCNNLTVKKEIRNNIQTIAFQIEEICGYELEFILTDKTITSNPNWPPSPCEFIFSLGMIGLSLILLGTIGGVASIITRKRKIVLLLFVFLFLFGVFLVLNSYWCLPA